MKRLLGITATCVAASILSLNAEDWPRFRGNGGLGLSQASNIPLKLSEESALWKIALKGHGHSAPVILGKKLFYTVAPEGKEGTRDLVCASTNDGSETWRKSFQFSNYTLHKFNSSASSSPTADEERVFVWWNDGDGSEVMALDHSGKELWKQALGPFESQHGSGSSVSLAGDVLIVQKVNLHDESFIAGLESATGKFLWKTPIEEKTKTTYVTPIIRDTPDGQEAIFASTEMGVYSIDPKTGKFRWQADVDFEHRVVATPVVVGNYLFATCGGGGGGKASVILEAAPGAEEAKVIHRPSKTLPYVPTGLGINGHLFLVNDGGVATCLNAKEGKLVWRERLLTKCFASPIAIGDKIYAFGRDGDYKVFRATTTFELIAEGQFEAGVNTTPAVADGKLFVRTDEKLLCFHAGPQA